jgi:hypothetical protein
MTPMPNPNASAGQGRADYPDRIWVERDEETNEKRWFSIAGSGVEYVRALSTAPDPAPVEAGGGGVTMPPAAEIKEMIAYLRCADDDMAAKGEKLIGARFSSVRDVVRDAIATFARILAALAPGEKEDGL